MTGSISVRYAGFWRRLTAGTIDFVILLPVTWLSIVLDGVSRPAAIIATVLSWAVYYIYILPLTLRYGGTLGKLAVGIRVRPLDGSLLQWRHVWRRSAVDLAASVLMVAGTVVGLNRTPYTEYAALPWGERTILLEQFVPWLAWLNYLYVAWLVSEFIVLLLNHRRRALHDFIAGTVVVVTRSTAYAAPAGNAPKPAQW